MYAYKFGIVGGKPTFTLAGQTSIAFAGKGVPTVTSLNGQPGTGIVNIFAISPAAMVLDLTNIPNLGVDGRR